MELRRVYKSFGEKAVLEDVSLCIPERQITCLFGPSGKGKTTVLRLLAGLETADSGEVIGVGERRVSLVFQEDRLLPWCTAEQNVALAAPGGDASRWLERMGLGADGDKYPHQLSGGMCRRVALARALAYDGEVFLMDEPFKGLDRGTKLRLLQEIRPALSGRTVLFITHDPEECDQLGGGTVSL